MWGFDFVFYAVNVFASNNARWCRQLEDAVAKAHTICS